MNVLVISKPGLPHLSELSELPASAVLTITESPEEIAASIGDTDIILNANMTSEPFRTVFPQATKVRWVHSLSAGVEGILSPELMASAVPLTNGRGVFKASLAEFAIGAILYFAKDFARMRRNQAAGQWEQFDIEMLDGATLGIVGYGEIGKAAAKLADAFGMKILTVGSKSSKEELHAVVAASDYLLMAAPKTASTIGLIGAAEIALMKPTAVILNVGRGPVIVEAALVEALEQKRIKGAALDVFDVEPLPAGHAFYKLDNVLLSPHCADHTSDWIHQAVRKFVENYRKFEAGQPLDNIVDKHAGY